jgi:hypothetical protein
VSGPWVYVVLFVIAAIFGLHRSTRLTRRYADVRDRLDFRESWILFAIVAVSWAVTLAACWYGVLALLRLAGLEPLAEAAIVSSLIATIVLFIPLFLDAVVERVARVPWK